MLAYYRLARGAGHAIFASLAFALFNRRLGSSASDEQLMRAFLARVADLEKRSRAWFLNPTSRQPHLAEDLRTAIATLERLDREVQLAGRARRDPDPPHCRNQAAVAAVPGGFLGKRLREKCLFLLDVRGWQKAGEIPQWSALHSTFVSTLDQTTRRIPTQRVKGATTEVPRPPRAD
jgi:hypothetical protein